MNFSRIFWGAVGVLAVAVPAVIALSAVHVGVPELSSGLISAAYFIGGIACALSIGGAFVLAWTEESEKPIFSLMGAGCVGMALMMTDVLKDSPGFWWTMFALGALILLWRGAKFIIHTPLFEVVLAPGVNYVAAAPSDNLSADKKFAVAERMYRKLAIPAGYGRTGMDYYSRGGIEHRYGSDGMPTEDVKQFVEAAQRSGLTRSTHLVILVRNMPGKQTEPAVIIAAGDDMKRITREGDGIRVLSCLIPAKDIAGVVFYGWLGYDG